MEEIESIPERYRESINDFIRIGKRIISQVQLLHKTDRLYRDLEYRIMCEFMKHSSKNFSFNVHTEKDGSRELQLINHTKKVFTYSFVLRLRYAKAYNEMFLVPLRVFEKYSTVKEELDTLINEVQRATVLDFFEFKRIETFYVKITKLLNVKRKTQDSLYFAISRTWDIEHFPKVGDRIRYTPNDNTDFSKKCLYGTLREITGSLRSSLKIETDNGGIINRWTQTVRWNGCFADTNISRAMQELAEDLKVPECWVEKKVDYYK